MQQYCIYDIPLYLQFVFCLWKTQDIKKIEGMQAHTHMQTHSPFGSAPILQNQSKISAG